MLDLWFERVVKPRLRGEAYMVRYLDDFVGTGGNNLDLPALNPINNYNLLQLDLTWRF